MRAPFDIRWYKMRPIFFQGRSRGLFRAEAKIGWLPQKHFLLLSGQDLEVFCSQNCKIINSRF